MNKPIILQDALKKVTLDQDKVRTPQDTVAAFKNKIKTLDLNILDKTVRIDNGRLDIPVYFSLCGHDAKALTGTNKQMGKGATPQQAEASAVMELAERFSFFSFAKNPQNFITDTYENVGPDAIEFDLIAKSVHDQSEELSITRQIFSQLPLKWTWGYNMTQERPVLIPFDWFYAINEFNGPCAGNCAEEAISQGICEIVERHVSSIVSHERRKVPLIDVSMADNEMVIDMLGKYQKAGIKLYLSDFSLDMGIPTVGALAYDPGTFPKTSEIVWTAGTTPDPQKALSRALTEVAQLAGDFNSSSNYVASGLPKFTDLDQAAYVTDPGSTIKLNQLANLSDNNIRIEVQRLISALSQRKFDVILIDTMHAKLGIPAFYTIVPGAHFRERALGTSVGMFCSKLIYENNPAAIALDRLTQIAQKMPARYFLQFYIGSCKLNLNMPKDALVEFEKALDLNPTTEDRVSIYSYMGVCLKEMEDYKGALKVLLQGESLDTDRTDIYNLMGFCHFKLKEHEKAIECFKRVVELNPMSAIDYANIASNYRELGQKEQAIHYYQVALELDGSIEFAQENLVRLLSDKS